MSITLTDKTTLIDVWYFLNDIKVQTVKILPELFNTPKYTKDYSIEEIEYFKNVKLECDDLFRQASGNRFVICPAWWIGGF